MIRALRARRFGSRLTLALVVIIAIIVLDFPIYWMFVTSMRPVSEIMSKDVSLLPKALDFSHYKNIWFSLSYAGQIHYKENLINSFVVVGSATALSVCIAILAGYSLARFKFRGKEAFAQGALYVYMFPQMILLIPLLILVMKIGLYNTRLSLIIVYCTFALPYSIWMMRGYFATIPVELEEAAIVDGCSRFRAMTKVTLPLAAPGVVATAIYAFILGWNDVIYPLTFISIERKTVVSVGFMSMISGDLTPWGGVMAASVMTSIPVLILFLILQKALVSGLTQGAVKG
jgi:ABC-type glycerol-3-phosphate transport system permease component